MVCLLINYDTPWKDHKGTAINTNITTKRLGENGLFDDYNISLGVLTEIIFYYTRHNITLIIIEGFLKK